MADQDQEQDQDDIILDLLLPPERLGRLRDMVLLKHTLDMTIIQLQACYLRTIGLMERGLLPNVHVEMINLAVSCDVLCVLAIS